MHRKKKRARARGRWCECHFGNKMFIYYTLFCYNASSLIYTMHCHQAAYDYGPVQSSRQMSNKYALNFVQRARNVLEAQGRWGFPGNGWDSSKESD
jgi:hypothetical protein